MSKTPDPTAYDKLRDGLTRALALTAEVQQLRSDEEEARRLRNRSEVELSNTNTENYKLACGLAGITGDRIADAERDKILAVMALMVKQ